MRYRAGAILLAFAALFLPVSASAHVYKTDGTLQALLHLNPNDEPVAGQTSGLMFSITDSSNRFATQLCDCRITIKDGNHTLVDRPLTAGEALSAGLVRVNYTFLYQAVYAVTLAGTPRQAGAFQPFKLDYDVPVERGTVKSPPSPLATWGLLGAGGVAVIAAVYFIYRELKHDEA